MRKAKSRPALALLGTAVVLASSVLLVSCAATSSGEREAVRGGGELRVLSAVGISDVAPRGVVLERGSLWMVDAKTRELKQFDIERGVVLSTVPLEFREPRGVAWDGRAFWVVDNKTKMVHQVEPRTGAILRSIDVPIYTDRDSATLEAAAWDGEFLWVAYSAGWSSRIHRVDVETGQVTLSMFANGLPRGLASDGKRLWMVSYNMGRYTGVVTERTIVDDAEEMNLTVRTLGRTPGKEPAGLAFDGRDLWVADGELKSVHKIALP